MGINVDACLIFCMLVHLECGEDSKLFFHFDIIIECDFYESEFLSNNYQKSVENHI